VIGPAESGPGPGADGGAGRRPLFEHAPIPTAEHDYSEAARRLRALQADGLAEVGPWLLAHPSEIAELARCVRVLDINAAGMALTGARDKGEATASLYQYFTAESLPAFASALVALVAGTPLVECEFAFRDRQGRDMTVIAHAAPLPGSEESLKHVLFSFQDVTARKQSERLLRESEAALRASQWIARLGHYVLDVERSTWSSSEALDDVFGIGPEHPHTTEGWLALIHPEERDAMRDYFAYSVLAARRPFDRQYRILRPSDGAVRWVHGRGELELNAFGVPVRMIGIIQDVTELREAAEEKLLLVDRLRHAAKMESLGRLAGGVAHDFNNMLAVILGNVDLALKSEDLGAELRSDLREIQDAATRSAELTRQLLGFARQQPIRPRPLGLNHALQGMARMLEKLATERVRLEVRLAPDLWPTLADPSQVDQVVTNLVANARDAIGDRGSIRIETANATIAEPHSERTFQVAPGDYATLSVTDSGDGMDAATLRHLFEPFFTTKAAGRGTGLGLATVYGIIRQNGGGVEVRSALGAGTTFRILFPRHRDEGLDAPAPTPSSNARVRGETILVVEDEPAVLSVVRRVLEGCGYRVLSASTPTAALELLRDPATPIHLLVTDLAMPELSGRELFALAIGERPALRALFLSGHPVDAGSGVDVEREGLDFLQKPFTPSALATRVRELLDR